MASVSDLAAEYPSQTTPLDTAHLLRAETSASVDDLWEEQKRIEEDATLAGIRRAARTAEKARAGEREASSAVGAAMVKRIVGPMEELLLADLNACAAGKATKGGASLRVLREVSPTLLCTAATRAALSRMSRTTKLTAIARRIGEALEDEVVWHHWETKNKAQAAAVRKRVEQSSSPRQRRLALRGFARAWERTALRDAWSSARIIGIGLRFIDYLVRLDVLEMTKISMARKSAAHAVRLSPAAAAWAKELGDFIAVSRPLAWPLVVPPVPWTVPLGGGFHFREGQDHPLIPRPLQPLPLVRRASKEQRAMLEKADLSVVYAGLNAAQATAWRVNPRVYAVLVKLMEQGHGPGITRLDPKPVPGRLSDELAKDPDVLRAHKAELRKIKTANATMVSKRFGQHRVFAAARKFVPYSEIYFAYNLDFRGRVYACSDDLSPQGNDIQRGLLEFAHGDPMTPEGMDWLRVHLANTWGFDKASFEDRRQWAIEHHDMILAVGTDPLECIAWHGAEEKTRWQFLAACCAYADFKRDGLGSICRVPVMLDGSCSGIQHYAAMLRDEVAGAAVNLVPADKPGDLYADVAAEVNRALAESREPFAAEWLAWGIDRSIVKRSVMVMPYGGTFVSNLEYVRDTVRKRFEKKGQPSWFTEDNEQAAYVMLAGCVWRAMRVVVKGPVKAMKWVRDLASKWAAELPDTKLHWTAPCGFPVVTDYRRLVGKAGAICGTVGGMAVTLTHAGDPGNDTDWAKVKKRAAPNFVHSLDASHLLLSLKQAATEGITDLAMVHDAFGTTPARTAELARILREEFSKLYANSPIECLREAMAAQDSIPPAAPTLGLLDPLAIARSQYLFS